MSLMTKTRGRRARTGRGSKSLEPSSLKTTPPILLATKVKFGPKTPYQMNNLEIYGTPDYKVLTGPERTVFKNAVEALSEKGLFRLEDIAVIAGYARNVVLARTASRDVQRLGTVITFKDRGCTKYKTNPAVDIMRKAQNDYEDTAIKLGLTPTGRKRLKGEGKAPKTELDRFMETMSDGE